MQYNVEKKAKLYFNSIAETTQFVANPDQFTIDIKKLQDVFIVNVQDDKDTLNFKNKFYSLSDIKQSQVIKKIIETSDLNRFTIQALHFILKEEGSAVFLYIVKNFFTLKSAKEGIQEVFIFSVIELDDEQKNKIEQLIRDRIKLPLKFIYEIDKTLLAGVKVKINNKIYDSTLINKINKLEIFLKGKYNV